MYAAQKYKCKSGKKIPEVIGVTHYVRALICCEIKKKSAYFLKILDKIQFRVNIFEVIKTFLYKKF
jgi:hypothetical protein